MGRKASCRRSAIPVWTRRLCQNTVKAFGQVILWWYGTYLLYEKELVLELYRQRVGESGRKSGRN